MFGQFELVKGGFKTAYHLSRFLVPSSGFNFSRLRYQSSGNLRASE